LHFLFKFFERRLVFFTNSIAIFKINEPGAFVYWLMHDFFSWLNVIFILGVLLIGPEEASELTKGM